MWFKIIMVYTCFLNNLYITAKTKQETAGTVSGSSVSPGALATAEASPSPRGAAASRESAGATWKTNQKVEYDQDI